ncbi:MAG: glycosyltransferase [Lewinellaceae bacterium]|nr:glycosyl transferase family 28 [Phaeodactylibacter sp.]MCB9037680.1 glycosyltransferase [Lewinellaceae bacterium]
MASKPRILVAPLDWGLGHATRCVPLIEEIQRQGGEPVLASAGRALAYLQAEFPNLEMTSLPAYNIRYFGGNMYWNIGLQGPKILRAAWLEHRRLQQLIRRLKIDAVISDNRFGCFSSRVPAVFVAHQLNIQLSPPSLQWLANRLCRLFIRQYGECWIPGLPGSESLAGALSQPPEGLPCRHIGLLSRLQPEIETPEYDILALLSGPEPQRSRLESILLRQLKDLPYRVLLVQGRTEVEERRQPSLRIEVVSYLKTGELQRALNRSTLVICRSGYSTLMDLAAMGKKALLIPTPGQTEQEYLARRMQELGYCPYQKQDELDVERGVAEVQAYSGFPKCNGNVKEERLAGAVRWLIELIKPAY